jgi:hypothetical protein
MAQRQAVDFQGDKVFEEVSYLLLWLRIVRGMLKKSVKERGSE